MKRPISGKGRRMQPKVINKSKKISNLSPVKPEIKSTRKSRREMWRKRTAGEENEDVVLKKSMLTNILTMTVRDPSKVTEGLCKQLKRIFAPNSLTKLENNPKMQDVIDVCDQLFVKQIIYLSKDEIKIAVMPSGPTYVFSIEEYDDNYKNFPMDLYKHPAFITTEGKCSYKHIFEGLGTDEGEFSRALHFYFKEDLVYVRHFCTSTEDLEDKFKVCLREIGPKLTLKLKKIEEGVFSDMKIKKTRYHIENKTKR
jgi:rRNA maturation protein Rpf1